MFNESDPRDRLVRLAEQQVATAQAQYESGIAPIRDLTSAEGGLITAKIRREESRKNGAEVVSLLEQLVKLRNDELKFVQAMYQGQQASQSDIQATMKSLIEAQAELETAMANE